MNALETERNMLFGMLAAQLDFISQGQFLTAVAAWRRQSSIPLIEILRDQDSLTDKDLQLLSDLVEAHVKHHNHDVTKSLGTLTLPNSVRDELSKATDTEIEQTLSIVGSDTIEGTEDDFSLGTHARCEQHRFPVLRPHAKGGLGEVFVANDTELNREVALKEIQSRFADDPNSRARFVLEAEITGGLEHPGIAPVYGLGVYEDGRPFYAMRFIKGDSLKEATDKFHQSTGSLGGNKTDFEGREFRQLITRFLDVCNAIEYAHSRGVLHRDLKPDNVMLGNYGETLVVDWGLAKATGHDVAVGNVNESMLMPSSGSGSNATQMGSAIGTPAFMSPEQAAGQIDRLDSATDIYGLGATLYYLLTGQTPISGKSASNWKTAIINGEIESPRERTGSIPKQVDAICRKAMKLQPGDRYGTASELALDIEQWLADEPVSAYVDSVVERSARFLRRNRSWTMAMAASLILISVVSMLAAAWVNNARLAEQSANAETARALQAESESRKRASARFDLAMDAVASFHQGASQDVLLKQPELEGLRNSLLGMAQSFYRQLADELGDADSPDEQAALGKAHLELARVTKAVGLGHEALVGCKQAKTIYEKLATTFPEDELLQIGLAQCYSLSGRILRDGDSVSEARADFQESIAIWLALTEDNPGSGLYQKELADNLTTLGFLEIYTGQSESAEPHVEQATQILDDLVLEQPDNADFSNSLAAALMNLGELKDEAGDTESATRLFRRSIDIHEQLATTDESNHSNLQGLANACSNLSLVLRNTGNRDEARKWLKQACQTYTKLKELNPVFREYQHQEALSQINLGSFEFDSGNPTEAQTAFEYAIAMSKRLADAHPNIGKYQDDWATGLTGLGQMHLALREPKQAIPRLEKAVKIYESLVEKNEASNEYQRGLAAALNILGNAVCSNGDLESGEQYYRRTIEVNKLLVARNPDNFLFLDSLAKKHTNLGIVQRKLGNPIGAEASYSKSIEIAEKLIQQNPEVIEPLIGLGGVYCNFGNMLRDERRFDDALGKYERALRTLGSVLEKDEKSMVAKAFIRNTRVGRAKTYDAMKEFQKAAAEWNQARMLADGDRALAFLYFQANSLANGKMHAQASTKAREMAETGIAQMKFDAACIYAACVEAAANDDSSDESSREILQQQYGTLAIELLEQLNEAGYFKPTEQRKLLDNKSELDWVRSRNDFQKLIDDLDTDG